MEKIDKQSIILVLQLMNKKNSKKFVGFLDSYTKSKKLNATDYSALIAGINLSYVENIVYDPSLVGRVKVPKKESATRPIDISNNMYYAQFSDSMWNACVLNLNATDYKVGNNKEGVYSLWQSQYSLWQKQHEAILNPPPIEDKPKKDKYVAIDASIGSLDDVLSIISNNEYKSDTEYNIDLKSLHNIKTELILLNNMIGMESMKKSIMDQLIYFIQELHIGKDTSDFKHTAIYGPPGTGKTEIAKIIGKMYSKLGILKNNVFKKVTRNDLIAGYLGQTAIKTKKVIDECLGGVLFIDEAYSLASGNNDNNDSYSKECIDILCEALSDHKDNLMVIIAGYEDELNETFFRVNKGMQSRFIWRFTMEPYSSKEMKNIFKKMTHEQEWGFNEDIVLNDKWFEDKKENFTSYGRDMELLLTYIKIAHGKRVYGKDKALRKKISLEDMNEGHKTFLKNKKLSKKDPMHLYGVYV